MHQLCPSIAIKSSVRIYCTEALVETKKKKILLSKMFATPNQNQNRFISCSYDKDSKVCRIGSFNETSYIPPTSSDSSTMSKWVLTRVSLTVGSSVIISPSDKVLNISMAEIFCTDAGGELFKPTTTAELRRIQSFTNKSSESF